MDFVVALSIYHILPVCGHGLVRLSDIFLLFKYYGFNTAFEFHEHSCSLSVFGCRSRCEKLYCCYCNICRLHENITCFPCFFSFYVSLSLMNLTARMSSRLPLKRQHLTKSSVDSKLYFRCYRCNKPADKVQNYLTILPLWRRREFHCTQFRKRRGNFWCPIYKFGIL